MGWIGIHQFSPWTRIQEFRVMLDTKTFLTLILVKMNFLDWISRLCLKMEVNSVIPWRKIRMWIYLKNRIAHFHSVSPVIFVIFSEIFRYFIFFYFLVYRDNLPKKLIPKKSRVFNSRSTMRYLRFLVIVDIQMFNLEIIWRKKIFRNTKQK